MLPTHRAIILSAASLAGAALLFWYLQRPPPPVEKVARHSPAAEPQPAAHGPASTPAEPAPEPPKIEAAASLGTADLALQLAAWPEGRRTDELPALARLLASRGPGAVNDIASALATAGTNSARGVLADALALIATSDAVQELCTAAIKVPAGPARGSIATAFRTLTDPAAAAVLATVFNQTDDPQISAEATSAIRRLADAPGVLALAALMAEDGQLHSQREALLEVLRGIQSPAARPALEALAADESDPARAAAARKALDSLP